MAKKKAKKLELELLIISDYASVSKEGKISIMGIFDKVNIKKLPARHGQMYLVAVIKGEPWSEHKIEVEITDPLGKRIGGSKADSKFGDSGKTNFISSIPGMPITRRGKYKFTLKVDSKKLGSTKIETANIGGSSGLPRTKIGGDLPN